MTPKAISNARLISQHIAGTTFQTPKEIVSWMGAMQAQDYHMAKWAIGARLPGSTESAIESAISKGHILRTHVLRPTWHFVSPEDIHWMLDLTAPRIKASMKSRNKELELSESVFRKSTALIEKALSRTKYLTREEIKAALVKGKITTNENRLSHLLMEAELDAIICSGIIQGKKQTHTLLTGRVPKAKKLSREEALGKLAGKYFFSHGPATVKDFTWWSGLASKDAAHALSIVQPDLVSEIMGSEIYWFSPSNPLKKRKMTGSCLLPAYDEFLISYKDRSVSLVTQHHPKTFSSNGIFHPVIVEKGVVTGLWKRFFIKDKVRIETAFFDPKRSLSKNDLKNTIAGFSEFYRKKIEFQ